MIASGIQLCSTLVVQRIVLFLIIFAICVIGKFIAELKSVLLHQRFCRTTDRISSHIVLTLDRLCRIQDNLRIRSIAVLCLRNFLFLQKLFQNTVFTLDRIVIMFQRIIRFRSVRDRTQKCHLCKIQLRSSLAKVSSAG